MKEQNPLRMLKQRIVMKEQNPPKFTEEFIKLAKEKRFKEMDMLIENAKINGEVFTEEETRIFYKLCNELLAYNKIKFKKDETKYESDNIFSLFILYLLFCLLRPIDALKMAYETAYDNRVIILSIIFGFLAFIILMGILFSEK